MNEHRYINKQWAIIPLSSWRDNYSKSEHLTLHEYLTFLYSISYYILYYFLNVLLDAYIFLLNILLIFLSFFTIISLGFYYGKSCQNQ